MNDIVKSYQEQFRRNRHMFRRYAAFLLALAMITTLFVNWQLHGVGISMTADYQCNEQEHTHTASCYEKVLVCGYTEGEPEDWNATMPSDDMVIDSGFGVDSSFGVDSEVSTYAAEPQVEWVPHTHTDDCYTEVQTLTCLEEEHVHDDSCFDPEDGSLICNLFEHTHDENCYTTSYELTCGLQEGELVEQVVEADPDAAVFDAVSPLPVVVDMAPVVVDTTDASDTPVHHHTEDCYEEVLVCPFPEHHHTVECLSDPLADVEDEDEWLSKTDTTLDGFWAGDLINVATSQLGYEESEKNFQLDLDDGVTFRYYTRYGQWYGNPYGEWDVMFLSYCLHYANIPQTAVPQRAGVLALRSDMRDMPWFQDVDGTNVTFQDIAPGDIVIYHTTVTESAVWEDKSASSDSSSSEDDSGIAVLPANISGAKPVVVDPSFTAPTAPTPVTTTYTEDIDTVGIVTDVDEEAKTLTVISGDVNGKVAERVVDAYAVESLIGVTAAQMAVQGNSSSTLDGVSIPANNAHVISEDQITDTTIIIDGTTTVVKEKGTVQDNSDLSLTVNDDSSVGLRYKFTFDAGTLKNGENVLSYKVPAGLISKGVSNGTLYDENNHEIGVIQVQEDGTVLMQIDETKKDITQHFSGSFSIDCWVDKKQTTTTDTIVFPGDKTIVPIKYQYDLGVRKSAGQNRLDKATGKYLIHYTVTVNAPLYGSGTEIDLRDYLKLNESNGIFANAEYKNVTLKKNGSDYADWKYEKVTSSGEKDLQDGNPGIKVTTASGEKLPALQPGESYTLEYDIAIDKLKADACSLGNKAYANDKSGDGQSQYFQPDISKNGTYDPESKTVKWTITLHPNGRNLKGFTIRDVLGNNSALIKGNVVIEGNGQRIELDQFDGNPGFEYKIDQDLEGYEYTVTYYTTVPDSMNLNDQLSNTAHLDFGNKTGPGSTGTITITDRNTGTTKSKTSPTGNLIPVEGSDTLFKALWSVSHDTPTNWTKIEIKDKLYQPDNSDRSFKHYAMLGELEDAVRSDKLKFTLKDGSTFYYKDLADKKLTLTMRYYDAAGNLITSSDRNTEVYAFDLQIEKQADYAAGDITKIELTEYQTYADLTGVQNGDSVTFSNEADGSKQSYTYAKVDNNKSLKKMSSGKAPGWAGDVGNYSENNVTVTTGNGPNGETYIFYQLVLYSGVPVDVDNATIVDTLPDNTEYVDGSLSVVARYFNGEVNKAAYAYMDTAQWYAPGYYPAGQYHQTSLASSDFITVDSSKPGKLTFQLTDMFSHITYPSADKTDAILIRYTLKVKDTDAAGNSIWNDALLEEVKQFTNSAEWNGVGSVTDRTDVKHVQTIVDKSGSYNDSNNKASYEVVINPGKKMLGTGSTVTLTDTLTVEKGNGNLASLVLSSIKLYSLLDDGTPGAELPSTSYSVDYTEGVAANGDNCYTLSVTVPNGHAYLLTYDYLNLGNTNTTFRNSAELVGQTSKLVETPVTHSNAFGVIANVGLTIHKVDADNASLELDGAHFKLEKFDSDSGMYVSVDSSADDITVTKSGALLTFSPDNTKAQYPFEVLYKLTETKAPAGYRTDSSWTHYFIWTVNPWDKTSVWNTAVGSNGDKTGTDQSNVSFYTTNAVESITVKNDRDELLVQKVWYDENGNAIDGQSSQLPESITVELYRRTTADENEAGTFVAELTLYKKDSWVITYPILDGDDYYYYIKETRSGAQYTVSYENNNVQHGGIIRVINTKSASGDYELPSTGGAGTTLYTAAGGTLMLAALVCGVRRKRRNEGRADQ